MTIRFADDSEKNHWDKLVLANPDGGNVLQGIDFITQKTLAGWTDRYIIADKIAIAAIEKHIPLLGNVWYVPKGPGVTTKKELKALLPALKKFALQHSVFTIKIEPEIPHDTSLTGLGLTQTRPIQANWSTVYIDVSPDLDTILKNMPQKGRHAIRRAERDGVTVERVAATDENCRIMYDLLRATASDAEFGIRSAEYYKTFYRQYEEKGTGQLFFAYFEGQVVAGAFAMSFGKKSTYKDGASIRKRTAYGASHLLQWEVIRWAKEHGSLLHDLCGAPPIARRDDPTHAYYGIGLFKTSFNKEITQYVGALEIPVHPLKSTLWTHFFEKIVRRLYYKTHHESYY